MILRAAITLVTLSFALLGLALRAVKLLLIAAGLALLVASAAFLLDRFEVRAEEPTEIEPGAGRLHASATRMNAGDTVTVTLGVSNPPSNPRAVAMAVLEVPAGAEIARLLRGPWEDGCGNDSCRAEFHLESGESREAQAEVRLNEPGATAAITAGYTWTAAAGGTEVSGETQRVALRAVPPSSLAEEPQTAGPAEPPPPTPEPPRTPNTYVVEKKIGTGRILGIAAITVLAAVALLGVGKFRRPEIGVPKALRSAAQRISARRGAEQAPREERLLPAGNRSLPFFIGIAGTVAHMATGGSPGAPLYAGFLAALYPLTVMVIVNWNRRSVGLYTFLCVLGAVLLLLYLATDGEDRYYYSLAFSAIALAAAGAAWCWRQMGLGIPGTGQEGTTGQNGRNRRMLPSGNRGLPLYIGLASVLAYMISGGAPDEPMYSGFLTVSFPLAAALMAHLNRGSITLYVVLCIMGVILTLAHFGSDDEAKLYYAPSMAVVAVLAGAAAWGWHAAARALEKTETDYNGPPLGRKSMSLGDENYRPRRYVPDVRSRRPQRRQP